MGLKKKQKRRIIALSHESSPYKVQNTSRLYNPYIYKRQGRQHALFLLHQMPKNHEKMSNQSTNESVDNYFLAIPHPQRSACTQSITPLACTRVEHATSSPASLRRASRRKKHKTITYVIKPLENPTLTPCKVNATQTTYPSQHYSKSPFLLCSPVLFPTRA